MKSIGVLILTLFVLPLSTAVAAQPASGARDLLQAGTGSYGCTAPDIAHYVAQRTAGPITVDGRLDEPSWQKAKKSARFVDMVTGAPGFYDTRAAVLWDDQNLYIGMWLEEPYVEAHQTKTGSLIWLENDAEVFIDGGDAYSEFEINALGTTYQVFFIWRDAYQKGGPFDVPEFDVMKHQALTFGGDYDRADTTFWRGTHPRGLRWAFLDWAYPGLQHAVHVDGKINDNSEAGQGLDGGTGFPLAGHETFGCGALAASARWRHVADFLRAVRDAEARGRGTEPASGVGDEPPRGP